MAADQGEVALSRSRITGRPWEMAMTEMSHDHRNGVSVDPGETRSLTMTFPEAGSQLVGCHEIGHYDAGMSGTLTVID